jgi:hypothetical protein
MNGSTAAAELLKMLSLVTLAGPARTVWQRRFLIHDARQPIRGNPPNPLI